MSSSHFDAIAERYDDSLPPHVVEHYLAKRVAFVQELGPPGRGLDIGCGTGALAQRLAEAGYRMSGVDPSPGMLEVLRTRAPGVEAVVGSGTDLPFGADEFDLVITVAVLHHIADPEAVRRTLAEMVRVLRPGGRIVVWDHNPRNPYWGPLMKRVPQDTGDERLVSEREITGGVRAAGGRVLSVRQLGLVPDFIPPWSLGAAARIERAFEHTPVLRRLAAHNVVVATK